MKFACVKKWCVSAAGRTRCGRAPSWPLNSPACGSRRPRRRSCCWVTACSAGGWLVPPVPADWPRCRWSGTSSTTPVSTTSKSPPHPLLPPVPADWSHSLPPPTLHHLSPLGSSPPIASPTPASLLNPAPIPPPLRRCLVNGRCFMFFYSKIYNILRRFEDLPKFTWRESFGFIPCR